MASPASDPVPAAAVSHPEEEPAPPAAAAAAAAAEDAVVREGEEEEEGECGFCLYMKGGGCREAFIAWEECVEAAGKEEGADMVERCFEVTANLKKCMDAHADYYAPVLHAEQAVSDHVEAAIAADAADKSKESGEEAATSPSTDESKVDDEKKEEVDEKSTASFVASIDEREEVVTEKAKADS